MYIDKDQLREELILSKKQGLTNNAKDMFKQMVQSKMRRYDFKEEWRPIIEEKTVEDMHRLWVKYNSELNSKAWEYMSTIIGCSIARHYTTLYKATKTNIINI